MNPKALPVILTMLALLCSPPASAQNLLFEDFSTKANMYEATAVWDTIAGQLKPNPFDIIEGGTVNTPGAARGIVVAGSKAFLADGYSGLQVIDITDPWLPAIVGTINTPGYSYEVRVAGDLAYVADHTGGLRIIDITDVTNPVEIGSYVPGSTALGLAVQGHLAFVGFGTSGGVHIVDVSNPALPTLVAALTTGVGSARAMDVAGDHMYVAAGNEGMVVFDISTPTAPVEVGKVSVNGYVNAVAVQGNRLVLSADGLGLMVCDVTDPTNPVATSTVPIPGTQRHISLAGNRAFVANDGTGIYAFDIANPYSPEFLWQHDTAGYSYASAPVMTRLYIADQTAGVTVLGFAQTVTPTLAADLSVSGTAIGVDAGEDLIGVSLGDSGVQLVDVTDPDDPVLVGGNLNFGGLVRATAFSGDLMLVAASETGLALMDLTLPAAPTLTGLYVPAGEVRDVAVNGELAYVAVGTGEVQVLDISKPTAPVLLGSAICAGATDVAVSGNRMAVIGGYYLRLFDVSNSASPVQLSSAFLEDSSRSLCMEGDRICVGTSDGLRIYSMADPNTLTYVRRLSFGNSVISVVAAGTHVVCTENGNRVMIYNVADDGANSVWSSLELGGLPYVALVGHNLLVGNSGQLQSYRAFQDEMYPDSSWAILGPQDHDAQPVLAARVVSDYGTGDYRCLFTNEVGAPWYFPDEDGWMLAESTKNEVHFRLDLLYNPHVKPFLNNITFEWRNDSARIKAVTDVPDDQGGWLRLEMNRSGYDFAASVEHQAVAYQVYQRVDDAGFALQVEKDGEMPSPSELSKASREIFQPEQMRRFEGRDFVSSGVGGQQKAGSFPAGMWEIVGNVFATQSDSYSLRVPTVADSTAQGNAWSVFVVTTHTETPSAWFVSDPDSAYSVDNIAPGAPVGVTAAYDSGGVTLGWAAAPEVDFQYYRVYRGANAGFVVGPENLVAETGSVGWVDPASDPYGFFYQVTALDHAGNESEAGAPESVSSVPGAGVGRAFALHPAAPNPFNPSTTIRYEIPVGGHVRLDVFDARGRLVVRLVDEVQGSGEHRVMWKGVDKSGQRVGSGVYFYRLGFGDQSRNGRMVLAK